MGTPPVISIESDKYCIGCICAKRRAGGDIILEAGPENSHRDLVYGWLHQVRLTPASVAEQEGAELDGGGQHRWELPVLHYHKIMVIYPYPFLVVITQLFS